MDITITKLYAGLSKRLDIETAENLSSYIDMKIEKTISENTTKLATKEDLFNVKEKLFQVKNELTAEIGNVKSDMVKWMVSLFITTTLLIIGLYLKS